MKLKSAFTTVVLGLSITAQVLADGESGPSGETRILSPTVTATKIGSNCKVEVRAIGTIIGTDRYDLFRVTATGLGQSLGEAGGTGIFVPFQMVAMGGTKFIPLDHIYPNASVQFTTLGRNSVTGVISSDFKQISLGRNCRR